MFLGLCITLLIWHADILYHDLPHLPRPLYPHLKKLLFPHDFDGHTDKYVNQCATAYERFVRHPIRTLISFPKDSKSRIPANIHLKRI